MRDLINRQDVIDALEQAKDKNAKGEIGGFYNAIIQKNINVIKKLPAVGDLGYGQGQWDMFVDITSAYFEKQYYFLEETGTVYSRLSRKTLPSQEDAYGEFFGRIEKWQGEAE